MNALGKLKSGALSWHTIRAKIFKYEEYESLSWARWRFRERGRNQLYLSMTCFSSHSLGDKGPQAGLEYTTSPPPLHVTKPEITFPFQIPLPLKGQ